MTRLWRGLLSPHQTSICCEAKTPRPATPYVGFLFRCYSDPYNEDHPHAGIGLMTPDQIHFGQANAIHTARQTALDAAFLRSPERFVRHQPKPPQIPTAVWINPPKKTEPAQA